MNADARRALRELKILTVNDDEDKEKEEAEAQKKASEDKKSA